MATPYLSEIKLVPFAFAPRGWALCDGQLLPINQNQALFSLLGTNFGGDGRVTFGLPDLHGRVPVGWGSSFVIGERVGEEQHTLATGEMPIHTHALMASSNNGTTPDPNTAVHAVHRRSGGFHPVPNSAGTPLAATGSGIPHENMQPFTVLNFVIALQGVFPSRN